jgi:hypothetical protein
LIQIELSLLSPKDTLPGYRRKIFYLFIFRLQRLGPIAGASPGIDCLTKRQHYLQMGAKKFALAAPYHGTYAS